MRTLRLSIALALCVAAASVSAQDETKNYELNISRQPLETALKEFAQQTGLQVARFADVVDGKAVVGPLTGKYSAEEAMKSLLGASGLTYRVVNERTIEVTKTREASRESKQGTRTTSALQQQETAPLRLAQAPASEESTASERAARVSQDLAMNPEIESIDEVVVTGSHIRGEAPVGSRVLTITREDIEQSGYSKVEDVMAALPQNFAGSASKDSTTTHNAYNNNYATSVDLRGLGGGTTLILVNGRRQPASDFYGSFVDISGIAASAIERVEILTDGASAIYGSDAIGGVVNFILRKDFDGAETQLRLGSADGNADEKQFAQLLGKSWTNGNVMLGYQYNEQSPLPDSAVPYLATAGDQRRFGGDDFRSPASNPGVILDSNFQPAYAIPRGQDGRSLTVADLIPLNGVLPPEYPRDYLTDRWYLPRETLHAAFLSASQRISDRFEIFAEARYSARDIKLLSGGSPKYLFVPASNPFNPFDELVVVTYDFRHELINKATRGSADVHTETLGMIADLGSEWRLTLSGSYGEEENRYSSRDAAFFPDEALNDTNPDTALNVFGEGSNTNPATIESLRWSQRDRATSGMRNASAIAEGPAFGFFGRGVARLAFGADYRKESLDVETGLVHVRGIEEGSTFDLASEDRRINAVFAELVLPLMGDQEIGSARQRVELSLAGRYEEYSDFGTTFNPKVGLRWQPVPSLQLRGTWGTSFKAPKFSDFSQGISPIFLTEDQIPDPKSSSGFARSLTLFGANPILKEETAKAWTVGFDLSPASIEGLQFSTTFFDIRYKDRISDTNFYTILESEDIWAALINRNPPQALVDSLCQQYLSCSGAPIDVFIDNRLQNLDRVEVNGLDMDIDYSWRTRRGTLDFGVTGTYMFSYKQAVNSSSPAIDVVDTIGKPLDLHLRGKLSWSLGGWRAAATVNYAGSYRNPSGTPARMGSLTTVDLNFGYRVSDGGWLDNSQLSLSVINVFDEMPPFLNTFYGYDTANGDVLGRTVNLLFTKRWRK